MARGDFRFSPYARALAGLLCTLSCVATARAQSVSGLGDVLPSPVLSPTWLVGGDLVVGESSVGVLNIDSGGRVVNDWAYIGNALNGLGTISVSGKDGAGNASTWISAGETSIGTQLGSTGSMTVLNGGVASGDWAVIGSDAGSLGSVAVSDAGSSWTLATPNAFRVGSAGRGTLIVQNGAAVHSG